MSKNSTPAQAPSQPPVPPSREPTEEAVREYAYYLYEQGNGAPGCDLENWLEATACLKANIPVHASRSRLHQHINGVGGLVSSVAMAKREAAVLHRGREELQSEPAAADSDVQTSL